MLGKLAELLREAEADFADIRYELRKDVNVVFAGSDLKSVVESSTDGYVVRVLRNGGFASATVTSPEDVPEGLKLAAEGADAIVRSGGKTVGLYPVEPVEDSVEPELDGDPQSVPPEEKISLVRGYNDAMLSRDRVETTNLRYLEVMRDKYYVNSEGSAINEKLLTTGIGGEVIAKKGNLVQNIRLAIGGSDGFNRLVDRDEHFHERAGIAERLLDAEPVKGGTYNVVLSPLLTGVFTHEAFGHFSEADLVEDNPSLREKMSLGAELGSEEVTIAADSTLPGQLGYYRYDDEGVPVRKVVLMRDGVLTGRLHSRRTATEFDEEPTGHAVAEDYRYPPIVRMGTIFIQPGDKPFPDLIAELGDGLYLVDGKGGQTSGENFTFGAQYGFVVEGGEIGAMVRDINIMGNLFTTLKSIAARSNQLELSERGGCGKGQLNIRSALGGPHILVTDMIVGGV
ncbi:TldD/PmbA family protein [Candidatus Fermentibacteria bacterium]|nr:TldD/PmbA family protein [Candidatus Fermentibacteria bacterium]